MADYFRFKTEVLRGEERESCITTALDAYRRAGAVARIHLPPSSSARIYNALSQSLFYSDVLNFNHTALAIAQQAYAKSVEHSLATPPDSNGVGSSDIMRLLMENIVTLRAAVVADIVDPNRRRLDDTHRHKAYRNLRSVGVLSHL